MKKHLCVLLAVCLLFLHAGCAAVQNSTDSSESTMDTSQLPPETSQSTVTQSPMSAVSVPGITEETVSDDDTPLFQYTYQKMSLVLQDQEVAKKVIQDFTSRVNATRAAAENVAELAISAYHGQSNWTPYLYHLAYSPTRIDHGTLSLFGTNAVFSGGRHPERTCTSANYDLITGDVLTLASIMSPTAKASDFCDLVLKGLSELGSKKYLYDNYTTTVQQRFTVDPSQDESWYFSQTGLCFYFAPYEIAPYASGVIKVEIPFEKLTGLLNKAYFPAERDTAKGSITVTPFSKVDLNKFSQIAEVIENKNGQMYMAYSDSTVQDVRIFVSDAASSYTIFAAYNLTPGDAVMVQVSDKLKKNITISYMTGNETVSTPLIA